MGCQTEGITVMALYTRMSNEDANAGYDKLKQALLTRYSFNENGYR